MIQNPIAPYFQQRGITLGGLQAVDIQMFYTSQLKRVSANTVIHYHAIIHRALKYAVKTDLIDVNPADKVERPRKDRFTASFYDGNEVNRLFQAARGTPLELPVMLAAFYGLRRSEVVGLKWDAIDFENKTIAIRHTVTACAEKGRRIEVAADTTKTASSRRTLPLVPAFQTKLAALKEEQEKNRILCGPDRRQTLFGRLGGPAGPPKWIRIARLCRAGGEFAPLGANISYASGGKDRRGRTFSTNWV